MTKLEWLDKFATNLARLLYAAKLTQRNLSDMSGLSEATICKYLKKQQMPGIKAIINIANALSCTIDELIFFGDTID